MKTLNEKLNTALNEARFYGSKKAAAVTLIAEAICTWIDEYGPDEYINWGEYDDLYNKNPKLFDELMEGGTKVSKAADDMFDAIAELYKVYK